MSGWTIGIIGGSGLYAIDGLEDARWIRYDTPWGAPSDELLSGRIGAVNFVFLPRHGRGHRIPPSYVNARANVDALKQAGCTDLVAVSAVGSLREELEPGRFVIVDQFIDRTTARDKSFFGPGMVAHVSMADPTCPRLARLCADAATAAGRQRDARRHLCRDGRPAIFDPRRKPSVSPVGLRRDRHDRHARGPARARGRAALRADRHGHRL